MQISKIFSTSIAPLVVVVVLFSCKQKEQAAPVVAPDLNVVEVAQRTVPVYTEYVGQTYGISDVGIKSRVEGWIMSMHFKEGDRVKKGQLLYVIDDQQIRNRIDEARASLASSNSQLSRTKSDLERVEPLTKMNALSQRDLDAAVAANNSAKAEVDAAHAALANAQLDLGYTRISSPIDGIIGISKFLVGDYVGRGGVSGDLNTVSALGEVRVRFPISESEYLRFIRRANSNDKQKQKLSEVPVELILNDGTVYPEKGKIDLANRQVDPETGSLLVQAIFKNSLGLLRPGQYVKVRFQTDLFKDAILVPQQAVSQLQSIYQVFVLTDSSKIAPRVVKTGARVGSNWIITEGLKPGEKVAIVGSAAMSPEVTVKPVTMKWDYDSTLH
jgi:membrane fusion protein (multidrug efflux system)